MEYNNPDEFLDVAVACGLTSQSTKQMTAAYFTAMSEETNLTLKQQRIINRYLTNHFGKRVCVAESEITEFGANFLEFQTEKIRVKVGDKEQDVLYSWKDLDKVLTFYKENLYKENQQDIEKVEVCLGGDHGKGKFTFIALVIVRYKAALIKQDDKIFEFQIGQIDHPSDSVELLRPLLARLEVGIKKLNPNNEAMCSATLVDSETSCFAGVYFDGRNGNCFVPLELFLIGDLKFMFMVLGRANYCDSWCLYRKTQTSRVNRNAQVARWDTLWGRQLDN